MILPHSWRVEFGTDWFITSRSFGQSLWDQLGFLDLPATVNLPPVSFLAVLQKHIFSGEGNYKQKLTWISELLLQGGGPAHHLYIQ